jgi:hypothetical protein
MVEMRDGLNVSSWALARVVVADRGSACCRSFASSIGPAVVGARIAVVSSRGGSGRYGGGACVAALLVELRRIVTQVSLGLEVASRTFTGVVVAADCSARCRSYTIGGSPAVVVVPASQWWEVGAAVGATVAAHSCFKASAKSSAWLKCAMVCS